MTMNNILSIKKKIPPKLASYYFAMTKHLNQ